MTPEQINDPRYEEANRRFNVIQAYDAQLALGKSPKQAARAVGQSRSCIFKYKQKYEAKGFDGLLPGTDNCGRKSALEKLGLKAEDVQSLMREVQGLNLDTESTTGALRLFAQSDRCPEQLANLILDPNRCSKHALPPSLRAAASVSKAARHAHRGKRTLSLKGIWIPRRVDILPGDIFVPDDTTPIFGWYVPWVESEEYPFGVKLLQGQLLRIIDVASQDAVGRVLIAREGSSYRASDIWSWVGFIGNDIGLPRLGFQMERGSWDATLLQGQEIEYEEGGITHARRVGGLRQLPTNITAWHRAKYEWPADGGPKTLQTWTSYLPKSKSIEAYFNRIQTIEGCLWGCLGRDQMRRPFEKAKQLFQQCSRLRAKVDPRQHFLSGSEIMARINAMDEFLAHEPMEGEVFQGIPRLKFQQAIEENPLLRLPEDQQWLFRRQWKQLTITQGWARVRLTDPMTSQRYSLFYTNPRLFPALEGKDVIVYYDRERFDEPAQIIAASKFEIEGQWYSPGDYVGQAQYFERPGMFMDGDITGHEIRKAWKNGVMTIYGRAAIHAPSRQLPAEIAARRAEAQAQARTAAAPVIVDGRPAAAPQPRRNSLAVPAPTAEQVARRRARLEESARLARELNERTVHTTP